MWQVSEKSKEGKIGRKSKEYEVTCKTNEVRGSYKPVWSHSERYWPTPPHPRETWQSQVSGCDSRKWVVTVSSETPARGICLTWQSSKSLKFGKILWIFLSWKSSSNMWSSWASTTPYKLAGGPNPPLSYISKSPMEATADIHILPGFAGYAQKISIQVSTISTMAIWIYD